MHDHRACLYSLWLKKYSITLMILNTGAAVEIKIRQLQTELLEITLLNILAVIFQDASIHAFSCHLHKRK